MYVSNANTQPLKYSQDSRDVDWNRTEPSEEDSLIAREIKILSKLAPRNHRSSTERSRDLLKKAALVSAVISFALLIVVMIFIKIDRFFHQG